MPATNDDRDAWEVVRPLEDDACFSGLPFRAAFKAAELLYGYVSEHHLHGRGGFDAEELRGMVGVRADGEVVRFADRAAAPSHAGLSFAGLTEVVGADSRVLAGLLFGMLRGCRGVPDDLVDIAGLVGERVLRAAFKESPVAIEHAGFACYVSCLMMYNKFYKGDPRLWRMLFRECADVVIRLAGPATAEK